MKTPLLFLLVALATPQLAAQGLTDVQRHLLDSLVTADVRPGSPGLAVGMVQDGNVIYSNYAGLADLESGIAIGPDTRFNLASTGKQFTAFATLRLIQAGKLSLDEKLEGFFPEFDPRISKVLTVRHLLTHTSGLRDQNSLWSLQGITWWKNSFSNEDVMALMAQQTALNFEPGSQHSYSNANYVVLAELVARVTGQDFSQYTQGLLRELNLEASAHEPDHTAIGPMAVPYFQWDSWESYDWVSDVVGDGAFFSTLTDQLTWEKVLQNQEEDWVKVSQSLIPGDEVRTYGYGLEFGEFQGRRLRYHDGSTGAWKATTWRFDDPQLSIVVMTNSGAIVPSWLAAQLAEVMLGTFHAEKSSFPLGPELVGNELAEETWLGTYQTGPDYFYRFVKRKGGYWLERPNRDPVEIEWEAGAVYHEINDPAFKQHFDYDSTGRLQVTAYYPTHDPYSLQRVTGIEGKQDYSPWLGTYRDTDSGAVWQIVAGRRGEIEALRGDRKMSVKQYIPNQLLVGGFRVEATPPEEGNIDTLWVSSSRLHRVKFERIED
ncbi:MAG TPA: hypothetical protein DCP28_06115 [Cytophagales bacterium]|nr:hypothetical protein [Cytophagales bacterium]